MPLLKPGALVDGLRVESLEADSGIYLRGVPQVQIWDAASADPNGLGKSFLLDLAWWALTRTWAGAVAQPTGSKKATIAYGVKGKAPRVTQVESVFHRPDASWALPA